MNNLYRTLLFLMLIFSCCIANESGTSQNTFEVIINEKPKRFFNFKDAIEDYKLITLETNGTSLIGKVDKVIFSNNKIFILDKRISKTVFVFDNEGKLLNTVGGLGKGPGEYLVPRDAMVNESTQELLIYCEMTKKILYYTFEGDFIKEINTGLTFKSFEYINNDTLVAFVHDVYNYLPEYGELPYDLLAFDSNINLLHKQFFNNTKMNVGKTVANHENYFCKSTQGIFIDWNFNDTIYKLDGFKAIPYLVLNFEDKKMDPEVIEKKSPVELLEEIEEGNFWTSIKPIQVADNKMIVNFTTEVYDSYVDSNYVLIDLESKEKLFFKNIKQHKDFSWKSPTGIYKNYFLSILSPSDVFIENESTKSISDDMEFGNPTILLYKFKELKELSKIGINN